MKQITKTQEPHLLTEHRANQPAFFSNLPANAKNQLRDSLLSEQGFICCYCNKRIPEKVVSDTGESYEMKIEHYRSQEKHPELQLAYSNLFAACMGNEGRPKKLQTCDTKKGSAELTISLTSNSPNCETLFKYNAEGEISSANDDPEINRQINEVLNLNMQSLRDNRRAVYLEVQKRVETESRQFNNQQLKLRYFHHEREKWLRRHQRALKPFCSVAVYYLSKKIRQYQG